MVNDELRFMIDMAEYLSKDADYQYENIEYFVRWNLPDEIGEEWIDAKGIAESDELKQVVSDESKQILLEIISRFDKAFANEGEEVWSLKGMREHSFWFKQRLLARKFLQSIK